MTRSKWLQCGVGMRVDARPAPFQAASNALVWFLKPCVSSPPTASSIGPARSGRLKIGLWCAACSGVSCSQVLGRMSHSGRRSNKPLSASVPLTTSSGTPYRAGQPGAASMPARWPPAELPPTYRRFGSTP
ncbi:hypothetical protein D3C71_1475200 [compost metagenome]